jgi:hypothetical protein
VNCGQLTHAERLAAVWTLMADSLPALLASFLVTLATVPIVR